jgi:ATP-dependent Clp protease ATP-binding subunit ClpA
LDSTVVDEIEKTGYDSNYGARPIKRVIQKRVYDMLAEAILKGEVHEGDTLKLKVVCGSKNCELTYEKI